MYLVVAIIVCTIAVIYFVIAIIRMFFKSKSEKLSKELMHIPSYSTNAKNSQIKEVLSIDIPTDLNNVFEGKIISIKQDNDFVCYYRPYYQKAEILLKKFETFKISIPDVISKFTKDFCAINSYVKQHNEVVIAYLLDTHKSFFDHCLKYPLDKQQRRSIVSEEENCLVVSSAGSGKTSSIIGKVKYLTEIKGISPERILLISYTNKAAAELT